MRRFLVVLVLASIAASGSAQPQQRSSSWDEMMRKGVLQTRVWTVNREPLPNGQAVCEAASFGQNQDGAFAIRVRVAPPNRLLMVTRIGQPFYNVHEIRLTLDDADLMTLPIVAQHSTGANQAAAGELTQAEFDQMAKRLNAGRVLTARVGLQDYSVPVMRFDDVATALGKCSGQREAEASKPKP
jgi:hypothetical protein